MIEPGWYLSEQDQAAINATVTRCIVQATEDIGKAFKESWSIPITKDGRLWAYVIPKDDERFWNEEQGVRAWVSIADVVRECRDGDILADDPEILEAAFADIEAAIAHVRGAYQAPVGEKNR